MSTKLKGRGTDGNPQNRFEIRSYERDLDTIDPYEDEVISPLTELIPDRSRSIIATNDSPDIGLDASINAYRGCEHGCVYCYARPSHEYLGYSAGLDFETKILFKADAATLLRKALMKPSWQPQRIAISGVTDAYQPAERKLKLTRSCLEVLAEFRNPAAIITKNQLVARDADILAEMAAWNGAAVFLSITTLDRELAQTLEPRASTPNARLEAISKLNKAGVPVGVMVAPIIPGLNDHEIPTILAAAAQAGAKYASFTILRLPLGVADLFTTWLDRHAPLKKEKILGRIRSIRDGKLNEWRFGERMRGTGPFADLIGTLFRTSAARHGYVRGPKLSIEHFRRPTEGQMLLFD
jgi:DNA repair photolyase